MATLIPLRYGYVATVDWRPEGSKGYVASSATKGVAWARPLPCAHSSIVPKQQHSNHCVSLLGAPPSIVP